MYCTLEHHGTATSPSPVTALVDADLLEEVPPDVSALSVFLPGCCRISWGLPTTTATIPLNTWYTGRQYTPVLSIATMGHETSTSPSLSASRSRHVVPYSRTAVVIWPSSLRQRKHAR